jgi:hypothetical protein
MQTMKFDLVEINKLSPPSLWDLEILSALITTLRTVIAARIGGTRSVLLYGRMLAQHSSELRVKTRENLNMRIKAWVLQCPERIAWVRHSIGAVAIRRWHMNKLADYALTNMLGDWQKKWPNGFAYKGDKNGCTSTPRYTQADRAYNWKPFALTKIVNVERILYGQTRPYPNPATEAAAEADVEAEEMRAAYHKLWGVDIRDVKPQIWSQPRARRTLKPIEFTPNELVVKAAIDAPEHVESKKIKKIGAPKIYPSLKPKCKLEQKTECEGQAKDKPP